MATGGGCRPKVIAKRASMQDEELSDQIIGRMALELQSYWKVIGHALGYNNTELSLLQGLKSKADWECDFLALAVEKNGFTARQFIVALKQVPQEYRHPKLQHHIDDVQDIEMDYPPSRPFLFEVAKHLNDTESICVSYFKMQFSDMRQLDQTKTSDSDCMKQMLQRWKREKSNSLGDFIRCFEVGRFDLELLCKINNIVQDGVNQSESKSEQNQQMANPKNKAAAAGTDTSKRELAVSEMQETLMKMHMDKTSKSSSIKEGLRVVRGPNWRHEWGNQDGGEGHVGTVIMDHQKDEKVTAIWGKVPKGGQVKHLFEVHEDITRMGDMCTYRSGKNYSYDLRIFENYVIAKTHLGVSCVSCSEEEIRGFRWKCTDCDHCNLCTYCYMTDQHDVTHYFMRFDAPDDVGCKLSARCYSKKLPAYNTESADWTNKNRTGRAISYYRDHLPLLGLTSEMNGSYSCPFLVGERVVVNQDEDVYAALQEGHGGWNSEMAVYIGVIGTVIYANQRGQAEVYYEGCMRTWTVNNKVLTKVGPFSVGQQVTITEKEEVFEKYQNMHCKWRPELQTLLGKTGSVKMVHEDGTLQVEVGDSVEDLSPMCFTSMADTITKLDKTSLAPIDYRVVRGPTWRFEWGNQGTMEGHVGTVVDYEPKKGIVVVKWATFHHKDTNDLMQLISQATAKRTSYSYRAGIMLAYDLRIIDNTAAGVCHPRVKCDGCNCKQFGLMGIRWKCGDCEDYDLCTRCYMTDQHDLTHEFVRFDTEDHIGMRVSPRCYSPKFQARDMIPGDWGVDDHEGREFFYYRDHLPLLEQNQHFPKEHRLPPTGQRVTSSHMIESVVAQTLECPLTVGDRVIVLLSEEEFKYKQEGHGGFVEDQLACIGRIGCVVYGHNEEIAAVHFDGCEHTWAFNVSSLTKLGPFAFDDDVIVSQNLALVEKYQRMHAEWNPDLKQVLGKRGKVLEVFNSGNLVVKIGELVWEFSPVCFVSVSRAGQSPTAAPTTGTRVTRGPSWLWENQDQGEGHLGTVVNYNADHGRAAIIWDGSTKRCNYRAGAKNFYDLRIVDYGPKCSTKFTQQCKGCFTKPIRGMLWRCSICKDFDFCTTCYMSDKHHLNHPFRRITSTIEMEGVKLSARCYSSKIDVQDSTGEDWTLNVKLSGGIPCYYRDHLPLLGFNPAEHSLQAEFCIGDRVIVAHNIDKDSEIFADRLGTIIYSIAGGRTCVGFDDTTRVMQSVALERVGPFMIGDSVTVVNNEELVRRFQKKHATWQNDIKKVLGKTGTLIGITLTGNLYADFYEIGVLEISPMCFLANTNTVPSPPLESLIASSAISDPDIQAMVRALSDAAPGEEQVVQCQLQLLYEMMSGKH